MKKKVSLKSDEPNSKYLKKSIFWDQIWHNLGLNHRHAWARTGKHTTKLLSRNYFHIKNISRQFHQNLMNIRYYKLFILDLILQNAPTTFALFAIFLRNSRRIEDHKNLHFPHHKVITYQCLVWKLLFFGHFWPNLVKRDSFEKSGSVTF